MERLMMKSDSMLCPTNSFTRNSHNGRVKIHKSYFSLFLWVSMVLLVLSPAMRGQELAGTLSGTITDSSGAIIQNATITITLNGVNGEPRVVQSNSSGN